jgi:hypothetical protein
MKPSGFTAPALVRSPSRWTSKCRCGPDELPLLPDNPMTSPAATDWPILTFGCWIMWQ